MTEQQMDMEAWLAERSIYGWLGRPPVPPQQIPVDLAQRWRNLALRAAQVARMSNTYAKVKKAKQIETERESLINQIKDRCS